MNCSSASCQGIDDVLFLGILTLIIEVLVGFSTVELKISFCNNIFGEILWDYANILFLFKLLPTNFSIHQWIFPVYYLFITFLFA